MRRDPFTDPDAPDECDLAREKRQREDDKALAESMRNAAGTSPEVLRLQDIFQDGYEARVRGSSPSIVCEWPAGTPEHAEWLRGYRAADARMLAADLRRRAEMKVCRPCWCGGRGLCKDAA